MIKLMPTAALLVEDLLLLGLLLGLAMVVLRWLLLRNAFYNFSREADRIKPSVRRQTLELPVISAVIGITVGIGANLVASGQAAAAFVLLIVAIMLIAWSAVALARERPATGVARLVGVRQELAALERADWSNVGNARRVTALRRLKIIKVTGRRICARARQRTFWGFVHERSRLLWAGYVVASIYTTSILGWFLLLQASGSTVSGFWSVRIVVAPLLAPLQLIIWWRVDRQENIKIGSELERDARAIAELIESTPGPTFRRRLVAALEVLVGTSDQRGRH